MPDTVFTEETAHLATTLTRLDRVIDEADQTLVRREDDYQQVKRYMVDNRAEIDPAEMFQNELLLRDADARGEHAVRHRDRLLTLRPSPYFGRLDFQPDDAGTGPRTAYIGRHSFRDEDGLAVLDWRSPFAGMFYDADLGPAGYDAPTGPVAGRIHRKRQLTVTAGVLQHAADTDQTVRDEVLQRELGRSTDPSMRSIIATIQREQNQVIRDESDRTLVIQGVAGSGKTSIALHRIAYLLYRRRDRLRAEHVAILSPHSVFSDYISRVLPELGEEPVSTLALTDIAEAQLGRVAFAPAPDPLAGDSPAAERARLTADAEYHRRLEAHTARAVESCFAPTDLDIAGRDVTADWLAERFAALAPRPVKARLAQIAGDIVDRAGPPRTFGPPVPRRAAVAKTLTGMLTVTSPMALYRAVCRDLGIPVRLAGPNTLPWADVFGYLYVKHRFDGLLTRTDTRHLVIDEMQDYTPTQYAVIRAVFPCTMTVLGDVDQALDPHHRWTTDTLAAQFDPAHLVELRRSYRSTAPIMQFAGAVRGGDPIDTVDRPGPAPVVHACADHPAQVRRVADQIERFHAGGTGTLAVIARTAEHARAWADALAPTGQVTLVGDAGAGLSAGICVLPVRTAKGLEFDEVIIVDTDAETYGSPVDRGLLYTASTRALHRLTLTHTGAPSPHLPG